MKKNMPAVVIVALSPFIRLIQLYNANSLELFLPHVLLLGACVSLLLLGAYFLFRKLFRSHFSALLLCLAFVLVFVFLSSHQKIAIAIADFFHMNHLWLGYLLMALILAGAGFLLVKLSKKLPEETNGLIAVFGAVLLAMNLVPFLWMQLQPKETVHYKTEFAVDARSPSPNVYWFHLDGMLNTETVQKYYGQSSQPFIDQLEVKDFTIFPDVSLEANHKSIIATTMLMCPTYQDSRFAPLLTDPTQHDTVMNYLKAHYQENWEARYHNEILTAFTQKGYATHLLSLNTNDSYLFPATRFYALPGMLTTEAKAVSQYPFLLKGDPFHGNRQREQLQNLVILLLGRQTFWDLSPLLFPTDFTQRQPLDHTLPREEISRLLFDNPLAFKYYSSLVQSLNDELQTPAQSRFTLIHYMPPHFPYVLTRSQPLADPGNGYDIKNYPMQYEFSFALLQEMTDMILEKDPSAVIVLISDHGIHGDYFVPFIQEEFGAASVLDFWNNVFYAVRLPKQWDPSPDLQMLADPRNIGRYLVNTFVGQNYDYVSP